MWKSRFEVNISYADDRSWETTTRLRQQSSNLEILLEEEEEEEISEPINLPRYSQSSLFKHQCLLPTIVESLEYEQHDESPVDINTKNIEEILQQKHPKRTKVRELLLRFAGLFKP